MHAWVLVAPLHCAPASTMWVGGLCHPRQKCSEASSAESVLRIGFFLIRLNYCKYGSQSLEFEFELEDTRGQGQRPLLLSW